MSTPTIIDALVTVVEPDPLTRPTVDDSLTHPYFWDPDTLYAFPSGESVHSQPGSGDERLSFEVTLVYCMDRGDEEAKKQPTRAIGEAFVNRAHTYAARVAASQTHYAAGHPDAGDPTPWHNAGPAVIDFDYLTEFNARGFALIVRGYQYP